MIDALLENTALTRPCRFNYGTTKQTTCPNCIYDSMGGKSSGIPVSLPLYPFSEGQVCPYCQGFGTIAEDTSEIIYLMVIWEYKNWVNIGVNIATPEGKIQTISSVSATLNKIKRAKEIIVDTNLEPIVSHRFQRYGEPSPIGFGDDGYIATMWQSV